MVRRLRDALTIDDLRAMSRRRVPRMFYQYCDSGSYTQSTMERNVDDFAKISLRQRIACDISDRILDRLYWAERSACLWGWPQLV